MLRPAGWRAAGWRAAALLLVLLKLWLASGKLTAVLEGAAHDDALFVRLAASIARSGWLGTYDELTLAKGPMLSAVMAAGFVLGFPLPLLLDSIYAAAALTAAAALRAFLPHPASRLAILALILFNPFTTAIDRIERERLYPALALLTISAAIGLYGAARRGRPTAAWGIGLGLLSGLFWLTREEGLWLTPALGLLLAAAALARFRRRAGGPRWRALAVLLPPLAAFLLVDLSVAGVNRIAYGVFATNVFRERPFRDAYGALLRVQPGPTRYVPVPAAVRQALYRESPRFAAMRPGIEGWVGIGCPAAYPDLAVCGDIGGGHMLWAVLSGARAAGHADSGVALAAFLSALAAEVDAACDSGRLSCGPPHSGLMPPLDRALLARQLPAALARAVRLVVGFEGGRPQQRPSEAGALYIGQMTAFTHAEVAADRATPTTLVRSVAGWVYLPGHEPFAVALRSAGRPLPIAPIWLEGADVAARFADPAAHRLRFVLSGDCPAPCELVLSAAGRELAFPLGVGGTGSRDLAEPKGWLYLDRVETSRDWVPRWPRQARLAVLGALARLYAAIGPGLAVVGVAAWLVLAVGALRGRGAGLLVVATAPLLGGLALALVVALIDVTSFKAINSSYLLPASVMFLLFAGVSIGGARRMLMRRGGGD
ncbi:MAG: hypothetical protein U1E53_19780 [Dongiaceae bacterium]